MASRIEVKGRNKILKNLGKQIGKIDGNVGRGLKLGFAFLQGRIIKVTPIDFGFLRASFFSQVLKLKSGWDGIIGFTAKYAPFVHEKTTANFQSPGTQAKFLEEPIMQNADRLLKIVAQEAKIK